MIPFNPRWFQVVYFGPSDKNNWYKRKVHAIRLAARRDRMADSLAELLALDKI